MQNSGPLFSIVTVVFNGAATIRETIESVMRQTCKNFEYVIVDGGSNDGTIDVLKEYGDRIRWISERDGGIYDAMNKAVKMCTGRYVYFLGADDVLAKNSILDEVTPLLHSTSEIYYGDVIFKANRRVYDGYFPDLKFCLRNISHQAIFYPLAVYQEFTYELRYKYLADYVLNLKLKASGVKFNYINKEICIFNEQGASGTNKDTAFLEDRPALLRNAFPWFVAYYAISRTWIKNLING